MAMAKRVERKIYACPTCGEPDGNCSHRVGVTLMAVSQQRATSARYHAPVLVDSKQRGGGERDE
jgi:hypothetical protein